MCKKPDSRVVDSSDHGKTKATLSNEDNANGSADKTALVPTHTAPHRNTDYDWVYFLLPALCYKITPIGPLYAIATLRIVIVKLMLSLHWHFVDKDSYYSKISQAQLSRERQEYLTAVYMHMWTQIPLQLVFPSLFFVDASHIASCACQTLAVHVCLVEPLYYLLHTWLHKPRQMKAMHGFHHLSIATLPTTSSCQNAMEHVLYIATFGPAFLLPYLLFGRQHWIVIGMYLIGFDVVNAWGHTNVRVRHALWTSPYSPFYYLFYTPEFHLGHHAYFNANYSLFMPLWDHLFGTFRPYQKPNRPMLPKSQQDFVFIGHNGGLGHYYTTPEFSLYNVYQDYPRTGLPIKMDLYLAHVIAVLYRLVVAKFYYCSRFCVAKECIARIIVLARTPYDYLTPSHYPGVNEEIVQCIRLQYDAYGTRYFGLGNLNKMQQLNDSGLEIVRLIEQDPYLSDKKIRIWTGDTLTVASVYHQVADIPNLDEFFYIGAGGKVGRAVCELLVRHKPHIKIRIFSRNYFLKQYPQISYSNDLSEITRYKVVLVGKILSAAWYGKAFGGATNVETRLVMDYTVPALPIDALRKRSISHVRVGLLRTKPGNPFLQGHYDLCMSHDENHIVPCHFGCLLHTISGREMNEVGDIDLDAVEPLWQMTLARGFANIEICH
jgi:sterol desaturase/sphingolipid hydroxylase (fatty acid hydroxylase superfamily)